MKAKLSTAAGSAVLVTVLIVSIYGLGQKIASGGYDSEDHDPDHDYREEYGENYRQGAITTNAAYAEECGSCHMAYPAMLLPAKSWRKIMTGLEDHFGENAELDDATRGEFEDYLARASGRVCCKKLLRNLGNAAPLRITELPYFVHEHDEIPARFVAGNEQVKSLSQCNACHRDAQRGRFDEDDVVIPGVGRWDD